MDKRYKVYKRNVSDKLMCEKESILLKIKNYQRKQIWYIFF